VKDRFLVLLAPHLSKVQLQPLLADLGSAEATAGGRLQIGTVAGFGSEQVAGFILECMAGFVGIRTFWRWRWRSRSYVSMRR
jgi:hypothetical protein